MRIKMPSVQFHIALSFFMFDKLKWEMISIKYFKEEKQWVVCNL